MRKINLDSPVKRKDMLILFSISMIMSTAIIVGNVIHEWYWMDIEEFFDKIMAKIKECSEFRKIIRKFGG